MKALDSSDEFLLAHLPFEDVRAFVMARDEVRQIGAIVLVDEECPDTEAPTMPTTLREGMIAVSRESELKDEQALNTWREDQTLFYDMIHWVTTRATRCSFCESPAYWLLSERKYPGLPKDQFQCDVHRCERAREIPYSDVVRRAVVRASKGGRGCGV